MRSVFVLIAVVIGACSSSDDTPASSSGTSGATSSSSGGMSDASANNDGASTTTNDAGTDGGSCQLMGGTYDKTCAVASDCSMVARGCYCGAQPIIGVAKSAQPAAQACETKASTCGLGCANAPGHVGEDGKNDEGTGKNIEVICDNKQCKTRLAP